jgi:hypothetical protein
MLAPRRTRAMRSDDASDDVVFDLVRRSSPPPNHDEEDLMNGWDQIFEHDTIIDPRPPFQTDDAFMDSPPPPPAPARERARAAETEIKPRPISSRPPPRLVSSLHFDDLSSRGPKRAPLRVPAPALPSWKDATRSVRTGLLAPVLDRRLPAPTFPPRTPAGPIAIAVPREIELDQVRALFWLAGAAVLIVAATFYFLS